MVIWFYLQVMESIKQALSPLEKITDLLSGESYVTISYVIPLLSHLMEVCSPSADATLHTNSIKEKALEYVLTRYQCALWIFNTVASYGQPKIQVCM